MSNAPVPLTSFIGRTSERAEVKRLLKTTRLLTILGPGGCGKTRLALQVAAEVQREFADGIWFVDLAGLTEAAFIPQALAARLGLHETPGVPVLETILQMIQNKILLLVFDNCEHLVDACAALVERLLQACPFIQGLITSREALKLAGETIWQLHPLAVPSLDPPPPLDALMQYEAVQLFLDRATRILPAFQVRQEEAATLAQICTRLDGLPLAIELAATRIHVLSLAQIAARLDQRLSLLTDGPRTALPRHRTLRAVIDWSYSLLSPAERRLFCRLSVFANGWTLEAAETICADEEMNEPAADMAALKQESILSILSSLVEKSLVVVRREPAIRYSFLESIHHYAREQLTHEADASSLPQRHAHYFVQLAEKAEPQLQTAARLQWLTHLKQEYDNLRAALIWSLAETDRLSLARRLGTSLWCFWMHYGRWSEGRHWLESMKCDAAQETQPLLHLRLLHALSWLVFLQEDYSLTHRLVEEGLPFARRLQERDILGSYLILSSQLAEREGKRDLAFTLARRGVTLFRSRGDNWSTGAALIYFGAIVHVQDPLHATRLYEESCSLLRAVGEPWLLALSLRHLGDAAFHRQDYPAALVHYQESTLLYHESDDAWSFALGLENLAETLCRSSYEEKAALLFGAAQAQRARTLESALLPYHSHSEQSASLQQRLGRELFARRWAQGRKMTPREIALEVQALPSSVVHPAGAAAALVQEHECENTLPGDRRPASDSSRITLVQERGRVPLRLLALGPTQVYRGEHLLEAADWAFTKPRALLFYLLCYAPCAKSEVGLALWPEASQAQLRSCFHSALYHLRRVLGSADWIHFENQRYVFQRTAASCWFDVEVFEAHLVSAQQAWQQQPEAALEHYRQAIALYRGDFLQDCDEEAWLVSRRQTLRQGYLNALLTIGRCLFTQQQYAQAAEAYRQIIASEPFHEEAHRELMRCAARMGDRPQAVRHFQQLHARLSDELGVAPASETLALLARLRRGERI